MNGIANHLVALSGEKQAIREALNRKGCTLRRSAPLSAYPTAIDAIVTGADNPYDLFHVIFIDYDGTVLKDTWVPKGKSVAPPAVPTHHHLTFHGWNRSAAKLAAVPHDMCVGAMYDVEDGENWLKVSVTTNTQMSLKVTLSTTGGDKSIDWGDGDVTAVTAGGTYTHTYTADFDGWIKLTKCCLANMSTSSTINANILEYLMSWQSGNIYTNASSKLRAVCFGYGAPINTPTIRLDKYFRGIVFGFAEGNQYAATVDFNSTPGYPSGPFHLSQGEGRAAAYISGTAPTNAAFPVVEDIDDNFNSLNTVSKIRNLVLGGYTGTLSLTTVLSRLQLLGQTFPAGTLLARVVIVEDGAVPSGNITLDDAVVENFDDVLSRLGNVETAITLSLKNVPLDLRDAISPALVAKGYTVAFS